MGSSRSARRLRKRAAARSAAGIAPRCPLKCPCLCHDLGGNDFEHPGQPCPGKVPDGWAPAPPLPHAGGPSLPAPFVAWSSTIPAAEGTTDIVVPGAIRFPNAPMALTDGAGNRIGTVDGIWREETDGSISISGTINTAFLAPGTLDAVSLGPSLSVDEAD